MFFSLTLMVILCMAFHTIEGGLELTANYQRINALTTSNFVLNCTLEGTSKQLISMKLSKVVSKGRGKARTSKELVTMNQSSQIDVFSPAADVKFIGAVRHGNVRAFLSGTWSRVPRGFGGTYECKAALTETPGGSVKYLNREMKVKEERPSFENALAAIEKLQRAEQNSNEWTKWMKWSLNFMDRVLLKASYSGKYKNKFYIVYNQSPGRVRHAEAFCRTRGGYLAELNDLGEWKFVTSFVSRVGENVQQFFVSGRRSPYDGKFYWPRKGIGRPAYFNWSDGQPNNTADSQNCVDIFRVFHWKMTDYWCNSKAHGFICEVPWSERVG